MKTPEEIKLALKMCSDPICGPACPYYILADDYGCSEPLAADALAYINQLEARKEG